MGYRGRKWLAVYGYLVVLFLATPRLPDLIRWAGGRWSGGGVEQFVLGFELSLGALLLLAAGGIFLFRRERFARFVLLIAGILVVLYFFFRWKPNPYELTHLPEYAILGILSLRAFEHQHSSLGREAAGNPVSGRRSTKQSLYLKAAAFTAAVGLVDELYQGWLAGRHFTYYDLGLNALGGILGLTVLWAVSRAHGAEGGERRAESREHGA